MMNGKTHKKKLILMQDLIFMEDQWFKYSFRMPDDIIARIEALAHREAITPDTIIQTAFYVLKLRLGIQAELPDAGIHDSGRDQVNGLQTALTGAFCGLLAQGRKGDLFPLQNDASALLTLDQERECVSLQWIGASSECLPQRLREMAEQLKWILTQITDDPERPLSELSLVTQTALRVLPDPTLPLEHGSHETCIARFIRMARCHPERCAVVDANDSWTYGDLDEVSSRIGGFLHAHGIRPGDFVAVYARRSATLPLALLGILKAGAAFIVLDPSYPAELLLHRAEIAKPQGWIVLETEDEIPTPLKTFLLSTQPLCCLTLAADRSGVAHGPLREVDACLPNFEPGPDSIAYMAFTSGSTRTSKGVLGTHGPIAHFLQWHCETFGLNARDRFAMLAGLSHDPLLRDVFTPLWLGATLYVPDPEKIGFSQRLLPWLGQHRITVLHLTPALGDLLANAGAASEGIVPLFVRYAFFGGDTLNRRTEECLRRVAPDVTCINFYGATETPQAMAYFVIEPSISVNPGSKFDPSPSSRIPIGQGIRDVQLLILTSHGELAGIGEPGEIYVRTPFLTRGYIGEPELNARTFLPDRFGGDMNVRLFRTGDWGYYRLDGAVEYAGRRDDQVKVRGFLIPMGDIENTLLQHPAVKRAVVVVRGETSEERQVIAYVLSDTQPEPTHEELAHLLHKHLPTHMIPSSFVLLESFPLTPNGKIDRRALPEPGAERSRVARADAETRDALELRLIPLWEQALGIHPCGVTDNFFDLGGNSLRAASLLANIEKELGTSLSLRAMVEAPTIRSMAALLNNRRNDKRSHSGPIPLQPAGTRPPLFCAPAASGGSLFHYRALAAHIGQDQPLYALEPCGLDGTQPPHEDLEEMAAYHVQQIREIQPEGPYYLCGYSLGGNIAYVMARQLHAMGQEIGLLILFDTRAYPLPEPPLTSWIRCRFRTVQHLENLRTYVTFSQRFHYLWRLLQNALVQTPKIVRRLYQRVSGKKSKPTSDPDASVPQRQQQAIDRVSMGQQIASACYQPAPYAGDLVLLRAHVQRPWIPYDPKLGWEPYIQGKLTIIETPGTHFSLLAEPCVQRTAAHVRRWLAAQRAS